MNWGGFFFFNALCDALNNLWGDDTEPMQKPKTQSLKDGIPMIIAAVIVWLLYFCIFK